MKIRKLLYYLFVVLLFLLGFYYFTFIKPKSIESPTIISLCKKNDSVEVNLGDTFHYIQRYEVKKIRDTAFLEIYLTTIGNFMNKDKILQFYIKNDSKYIKIKDKTIKTSDIKDCQ